MGFVTTELRDAIGTVTFCNPGKHNCLSTALLDQLAEAFPALVDQGARVIILRAPAGSKVWSAGFDIQDLPEPGRDPLGYNDELGVALRAVQMCPVPVIAMIEGSVWGGACDLVVTCDMAMGTPSSTFAITPAKLGVPYTTTGIMRFVSAMGTHIAKEMFFTAQPISAQRAYEVGILNHIVQPEVLEAFTTHFAARITENSPIAIRVMKEQLRILGNSYPMSPETHERIQGLRRMVYDSSDYQEGRKAFAEKRTPVFKGE